jgi:hypothetical protein
MGGRYQSRLDPSVQAIEAHCVWQLKPAPESLTYGLVLSEAAKSTWSCMALFALFNVRTSRNPDDCKVALWSVCRMAAAWSNATELSRIRTISRGSERLLRFVPLHMRKTSALTKDSEILNRGRHLTLNPTISKNVTSQYELVRAPSSRDGDFSGCDSKQQAYLKCNEAHDNSNQSRRSRFYFIQPSSSWR